MTDCIFCRIVAGQIPSAKVYEDEHVLAFDDIAPQAPVHVLVVPKQHTAASAQDIREHDAELLARVFLGIQKAAAIKGIHHSGYRVVTNAGPDAAQTVFHLHFHVLGGRRLTGHFG
jgi:histidine triad (HIT) family protein